MKLPLAYYGESILRRKGKPIEAIDETIRQLVSDMAETMEANDGCGLAAHQVHHELSLFITCIPRYIDDHTILPGELKVFINPKIISYSRELWACPESCLSIPGLNEIVERPFKVTIKATNLLGHEFEETFEEYNAHVIMHENDHINGVLFIDRLSTKKKKEIENILRDIKKKYSKIR